MRYLIYLLFAVNLFSGEIFSEDIINKVCKSKGYIQTYKDYKSCQKHFRENNLKVKKAKNLKNESIKDILSKNILELDYSNIRNYRMISKNLSVNAKAQLHIIDNVYNNLLKESYSPTNNFNYSNGDKVRGPSTPDELKDYLTKYSQEHFADKLNFKRIVKFIDNELLEQNLYVYVTFPYRIAQEKHFKHEILSQFYQSFKLFSKLDKPTIEFLKKMFKEESNILVKIDIYDTLTFLGVNIDDSNLEIELKAYIDKQLFLNDYASSKLIEEKIMKIKILEKKNEYKGNI